MHFLRRSPGPLAAQKTVLRGMELLAVERKLLGSDREQCCKLLADLRGRISINIRTLPLHYRLYGALRPGMARTNIPHEQIMIAACAVVAASGGRSEDMFR